MIKEAAPDRGCFSSDSLLAGHKAPGTTNLKTPCIVRSENRARFSRGCARGIT